MTASDPKLIFSPPPSGLMRLRGVWARAFGAATRVAVHLGGIVGLYFAVEFAFVHDVSPTGMANAAFAITASLAALSFSYARNLDDWPELQARILTGGERLLWGAILMVLASLSQYADIYASKAPPPGEARWTVALEQVRTAAVYFLHPVAGVLFLLAVGSIHLGLCAVLDVLLLRDATKKKERPST